MDEPPYNYSRGQYEKYLRVISMVVYRFAFSLVVIFFLVAVLAITSGNSEVFYIWVGGLLIMWLAICFVKTDDDQRAEMAGYLVDCIAGRADTTFKAYFHYLVPVFAVNILLYFSVSEDSDLYGAPLVAYIPLFIISWLAIYPIHGLRVFFEDMYTGQAKYFATDHDSADTSVLDALRQENEDLKTQLDNHRKSLSNLTNQFNERGREIEKLEKAAHGKSVGHYSALDIGEIERDNALLEQQLGLIRAKHRLDTRSTMPKLGGNLCRSLAKFEAAFGSDIKAVKKPDFQPYEELRADFSNLNKSIEGFNESLSKVGGPVRTKVYQGYVSNVLAPAVENARDFIGRLIRDYHSDTSKHQISEADRTAVIMVLSDIRRSLKTVRGS